MMSICENCKHKNTLCINSTIRCEILPKNKHYGLSDWYINEEKDILGLSDGKEELNLILEEIKWLNSLLNNEISSYEYNTEAKIRKQIKKELKNFKKESKKFEVIK